jgi:O-antigen/teichoic acid export membrane protein
MPGWEYRGNSASMRKLEKQRIIKNISSSWFSLGISIVVGLFLSPFILHRLGDAAFGIWVLIFSITGYYGLFDLGIRSSIVRYVSKFRATESKEDLAKLINTSLFSYCCVGALSLALTLVLSQYVDSLFRIPPEFHATARWLLLMVGASVALGFPLGIVGGFLEGLHRFDILNWTNVASTLVRALFIVVALHHGYGLLMVAFITIILPLFGSLICAALALHICPVAFGWRYVDQSTFRQIVRYSSATFMSMVAGRLKFKTDEIVIGSMLSAAAITYFNVGARIGDYAGGVVESLAQTFLPIASESEAKGNVSRLRKVFVAGNRLCAFTILPMTAVLLVLGKSVIEVWVGKKYVATSYPVLVTLLIPCTFSWAQAGSVRVLFGMGKHRTWAFVQLAEGISNLILSIILARPYGILGVAVGTAIPLMCTMVLFMPAHLCRVLGIRLRIYLREAFGLPLLITAPLVLVLLLMRRWFIPHTYRQLAVQLLIAGVVYGLGLLWVFTTKRAVHVGELDPKETSTPVENGKGTPLEAYQQDL